MAALVSLFVPGDRPERFLKAAGSGAGAMIIDLEDAVGVGAKEQARLALRRPGTLPTGLEVFVRINSAGSLWHEADIDALVGLQLTGVILPKTENRGQVEDLFRRTNSPVVALIETAHGLAACRDIASASGVTRLAFGSIDYAADLGMAHIREALLSARMEIVLASRLAGLPAPIDGVTTAIDDDVTITDDVRYAAALGFGGKLCIHPKQVAPAMRGFVPSEVEIAWARLVIDAPKEGAVSVGGTMVDAPVRLRAQQILIRAGAMPDVTSIV